MRNSERKAPIEAEVPRHRRGRKTKPWRLEIKSPPGDGYVFFPDWMPLQRYATEADARKGLHEHARKYGHHSMYRLSGPDDAVIYPERWRFAGADWTWPGHDGDWLIAGLAYQHWPTERVAIVAVLGFGVQLQWRKR